MTVRQYLAELAKQTPPKKQASPNGPLEQRQAWMRERQATKQLTKARRKA